MSAAAQHGASPEAIQRHYDVGNDFFWIFLDATRTYSCALFEDGDLLEGAQLRKHDWHIEHACARGADRVLDVGCGWGSTLERLVSVHGVAHAVGLTLSRAQQEHVRAARNPRIEVRLESWATHIPPAPYDALISIGAFEHFARFRIPQRDKIEGYRQYFRRCHELLREDARMTLQTIAYGDIPRDRVHADEFIARDIFPESDLPRLADIAEACEGEFEIVELRNDREHYEWTCREWFRRLRTNRAQAVVLAGEETVRRYERYLRTFSYSFALGAFQLLRIVLRRIDRRTQASSRGRPGQE